MLKSNTLLYFFLATIFHKQNPAWISLSALVPSLNLLPPMASISSMKMMHGCRYPGMVTIKFQSESQALRKT